MVPSEIDRLIDEGLRGGKLAALELTRRRELQASHRGNGEGDSILPFNRQFDEVDRREVRLTANLHPRPRTSVRALWPDFLARSPVAPLTLRTIYLVRIAGPCLTMPDALSVSAV